MAYATTELVTVEIDGIKYSIDLETGESTVVTEFHVSDDKSAEWVMERLLTADCELTAILKREESILENVRKMKAQIESRKAALLWKFKNELEEFAKQNLPKGKKTWACPFGSIAFRTNPSKLKVSDPLLALEWAHCFAPEAIKVSEEFQISKLPDGAKADLMAAPVSGFEVTEESETATIKTGGG